MLSNLAVRAPSIDLFLANPELAAAFAPKAKWSIHAFSPTWGYQALLLGVMALLSLPLLIGRYTRICSLILYILYVSLYNYSTVTGNAGDKLFCIILALSALLPESKIRLRKSAPYLETSPDAQKPFAPLAGFVISAQLACMYCASGFLKSTNWHNGTAVYNSLISEKYSFWWSYPLTQFPGILEVLTYFILIAEMFAGLILFFPPIRDLHRYIPIAIFGWFHLSLALTLCLGHFPYNALALWTVMLPTSFWTFVGKRWPVAHEVRDFRPFSPPWRIGISTPLWCAFFLLALSLNIDHTTKLKLPRSVKRLSKTLRLQQNWGLFKSPGTRIMWTVPVKEQPGHDPINLFNHQPFADYAKPNLTSSYTPNHRWHKFLHRIRKDKYKDLRAPYLHYLCAKERRRDPDGPTVNLKLLQIKYEGEERKAVKKTLAEYPCQSAEDAKLSVHAAKEAPSPP